MMYYVYVAKYALTVAKTPFNLWLRSHGDILVDNWSVGTCKNTRYIHRQM